MAKSIGLGMDRMMVHQTGATYQGEQGALLILPIPKYMALGSPKEIVVDVTRPEGGDIDEDTDPI